MKNKSEQKVVEKNTLKKTVNISFRCSAERKYILVTKAQKHGITLSEHVENILKREENYPICYEMELLALHSIIKKFQEKIDFYENDFLKDLFNTYKYEKVNMRTFKGENKIIEINDIQDCYTVIINSFFQNIEHY